MKRDMVKVDFLSVVVDASILNYTYESTVLCQSLEHSDLWIARVPVVSCVLCPASGKCPSPNSHTYFSMLCWVFGTRTTSLTWFYWKVRQYMLSCDWSTNTRWPKAKTMSVQCLQAPEVYAGISSSQDPRVRGLEYMCQFPCVTFAGTS
jgi:hypothetical protein